MNQDKNLTIEEVFSLAIKNHQEGKIDVAQDFYNQVLKINPNYSQVLNNLGTIFIELKEYQKAKEYYEKAIEINPNYTDAHNNLGILFKELKNYQKAKECYEKAIEINASHTEALNNLGAIFKELKDFKKAKECYEKVIEIKPNHANAHNNLGNILYELKEFQIAKECYEKAIEINPNYAVAYNNLGVLFGELNENQKVKECYEKAIEINPNYDEAYTNLAIIFHKSGQSQKAISLHKKAIEINPNNANAHNNLGLTFNDLREYLKAIKCFDKVLQIDPSNSELVNNLATSFRFIKNDSIIKNHLYLKKLFLFIFKNKNTNHKFITKDISVFLFEARNFNQIINILKSKTLLLQNKIIQDLLKEELFHLVLQKSLIPNILYEKLLTQLRYQILFTLNDTNKDILDEHFNFIISLAEQCWLNEFIYAQSEKEINQIIKLKNKIENDNSINEIEIAILGCYMPLNKSKTIIEKLFNYKSTNILFNDLINVQIKEPLKEKELAKSIKSFGIIDDLVSKKVREQYEENPYPRWGYIYKRPQSSFLKWIEQEIRPNKIIYNNKFNNPNVLIAGCGTGSHPIQATKYQNANILAVDLSKSSLAYAKRKTEELGLKNIEYLHADILQLKKLDKKFDIIESSGVLVCMKNPIAGLKVLVDILEPHGFLKLGLYSEIARRHVVNARDLIKKQKLKNTNEDIKNFRQDILNKRVDSLIQNVTNYLDFYSTSNVRDLLFHVQEHRFTLPEISKILKDLNLEFLGFLNSDPYIKEKYLKYFPEDKKNISLDNWHQFEINNPDIFLGMYQFWVRKI